MAFNEGGKLRWLFTLRRSPQTWISTPLEDAILVRDHTVRCLEVNPSCGCVGQHMPMSPLAAASASGGLLS